MMNLILFYFDELILSERYSIFLCVC